MENKREKMSEENQNQHQHQDQGEAKKASQEQKSISQNPSFGLAASILRQNSSAVPSSINKINEGKNR